MYPRTGRSRRRWRRRRRTAARSITAGCYRAIQSPPGPGHPRRQCRRLHHSFVRHRKRNACPSPAYPAGRGSCVTAPTRQLTPARNVRSTPRSLRTRGWRSNEVQGWTSIGRQISANCWIRNPEVVHCEDGGCAVRGDQLGGVVDLVDRGVRGQPSFERHPLGHREQIDGADVKVLSATKEVYVPVRHTV